MNTSTPPRWPSSLCLALLVSAVLGLTGAGAQPDPLPQAPAPRLKGATERTDVSSLVKAMGKRDWPGVEKAFRELGPQASAELLLIALGATKEEPEDEPMFKGKIAPRGPPVRYPVRLSAGKKYVIDMESNQFDTHLELYNSANKLVDDNDDWSKDHTNSRIVYTPIRDDVYTLVARESPNPLRPHTGDEFTIKVRTQGTAGPKASRRVDVKTQLNTKFKSTVELELSDVFRGSPIGTEKKEELQRATQKYLASLLDIVNAADARGPKADAPEALRADLTAAAKDYDHQDWLKLAGAFPYPLTAEVIADLAQKCLFNANTLFAKERALDDTVRFLKTPTRHFGLTDPALAKRLRSVLLLYEMEGIGSAGFSLPPAREVVEWTDADARASGLKKSDVIPLYFLWWDQEPAALHSTPLQNVLGLLASDIENRDADVAGKVAGELLRNHRASLEKCNAIAAAVAKRPTIATVLRTSSAQRARLDFETGSRSLRSFLGTSLNSKPLDEAKNRDLVAAKRALRDAWIAALVSHRLTGSIFDGSPDRPQKLAVAERATDDWLALCTSLLASYGSINNSDVQPGKDRVEDLKILLPVAKREAFAVGNMLEVAPTAEMLLLLEPSRQSDVRIMRGKLLSLECRYNDVIELCKEAVKTGVTWDARDIVREALKTWLVPPHHAGRSPVARTRMGDQTPKDFGEFVAALRKIPGFEPDESLIMETFGDFCSGKRPVKESDLRAVLPEMPAVSEQVMRLFAAKMLRTLHAERGAATTAREAEQDAVLGDAKKKEAAARATAAAAGEAQETSDEYRALDAILEDWRKAHPTSWAGARWHAHVRFFWARHQLEYVEKLSIGANTDVAGYSGHLKESMRLMRTAGELCPHSNKDPNGEYESLELLRAWFKNMYVAAAERATKETHAQTTLAELLGWLSRLPEEESRAVRRAFAQRLLRQLVAPDESDDTALKDIEIYHCVTGAVAVLGDLPEAAEFKTLQAGYRELQSSIRFCVVPDGTVYREGHWVGGQKRTFAVGKGEFGVWLTLQHTAEARQRSGGFRRYAQNQIENPGTALDARAAANYANDTKTRLKQYLDGVFTIVHVEPLPQAEPVRNRGGANGEWQETPLYYMILKPVGSVPVTRIPALPLDLNFSDPTGIVVLPFLSDGVDLDPSTADPAERQGITVKQRLLLNPRDVAEGLLTLEIKSTGRMVPPPPEELFSHVCSPGFEKDAVRCKEEIKVVFQRGGGAAEVTRISTIAMRWRGMSGDTEFQFPTSSAGVKIDRFVWSPDSALGESEGQPVPGETWRVRNLPHGPIPWMSLVGCALAVSVLTLLTWCGWRLLRRPRRVRRAAAYAMPASVTTLGTIRLLRQLAGNPEINFSKEDRARIEDDIRELEDAALTANGDGKRRTDVAALLRRWIDAANRAAAHPTPAN
jgi:hypothetical protein